MTNARYRRKQLAKREEWQVATVPAPGPAPAPEPAPGSAAPPSPNPVPPRDER